MQAVSETYTRLLSTPGVIKQHKAVINGVEYDQDHIVGAPATSNSLYAQENGPVLGQTNAAEIDLSIRWQGEIIPKMAEIRLFTRLAAIDHVSEVVTEHSEWLQKGVFVLDYRKKNRVTGALDMHGYDRLLLAEDFFFHEGDAIGTWPRPMDEVVGTICQRIGVTRSADTVIRPDYMVPYPDGLTMREMLGYAAACHGANVTITDAGELRFVPLVRDGQAVSDLGQDMTALDTDEAFAPFSGVAFYKGSDAVAAAGDSTGRVISVQCPWATDEIAQDVLQAIEGGVYQPYSATSAVLDPAVELGDKVRLDGLDSVAVRMETVFSGLMTVNLEAPFDEEVEHEIPFVDKRQAKLENEAARSNAELWTGIDLIDHLSTSRRIPKYLLGDKSDDNFITVRGLYMVFIHAVTDGTEANATAPDGKPLYWDAAVERATLESDGYYYADGYKVKMTTKETPYPVKVYVYQEQEIASWKFQPVLNPDGSAATFPTITLGAGSDATGETDNGKGRVQKHFGGVDVEYQTTQGKVAGVYLRDDGFADVTQRRAGVTLDTTGKTITISPEGTLVQPYVVEYTEDENGALDLTWPDGATFRVEVV